MLEYFNYDRLKETAQYPLTVGRHASPGKIMFVINFLLLIVYIAILLTAGIVFYFTVGDFTSDTGSPIWGSLIVVCASSIIVCIVGMRGSHLVSLDILINYFWGTIVLIVPLAICIYGSYNYLDNSRLYAEHQWQSDSYRNIRMTFCDPKETANGKCEVPFIQVAFNYPPGNATIYDENQWCVDNYNSTDCVPIRDSALDEALIALKRLAQCNSALAGLAIVLNYISLHVCFQILTSPVLSQTMNDNINFLLIIPMAGCVALTVSFWWQTRLEDTFIYYWIVYLYLSLACAQAAALTYGIFAGRSKSRLLLRLYLFFLIIIIGGFLVGGSIAFNIVLEQAPNSETATWNPDRETISDIACTKGLVGCTNCDEESDTEQSSNDRCPEWSTRDVRQLLSVESQLIAVVCILFSLYHVGAFIVTYVVQDNLKNYRSDFV